MDTPTADELAREQALRAGLADYELGDEDLALLDPDGDAARAAAAVPPRHGRRRRPAQRRQVDPGQPDHRTPRGRRGGHPRRDARPRRLQAEWAGARSSRRHRRLGDRRRRPGRAGRRAGRDRDRAGRRRGVRRRRQGRRDRRPTSASYGCCASLASRCVLVANKVDGPRAEADAAALWNLGLGEPHPVSALHGRGTGDLLDALVARRCPTRRPGPAMRRRRTAPGGPRRAPERRQVLACSTSRRRGARGGRRGRRHHPGPGRRDGRARRHARGGSSTPRASGAGCT